MLAGFLVLFSVPPIMLCVKEALDNYVVKECIMSSCYGDIFKTQPNEISLVVSITVLPFEHIPTSV